ncbi:hypothetical protein FKM82_031130 [Ascaphus truei]
MNIEDKIRGIFLKCCHTDDMLSSRGLAGIGEAEQPCVAVPRAGTGLLERAVPHQGILAGQEMLHGRELPHSQEIMSHDELMVQEETVKNDEEEMDTQDRLLPHGLQYAVSLPAREVYYSYPCRGYICGYAPSVLGARVGSTAYIFTCSCNTVKAAGHKTFI